MILKLALYTCKHFQRGHSTASMAGRISGDTNASLLVLNHISSKSDRSDNEGNSNHLRLISDAKKSSKGKSDVLVAYDFMEILVPRMGFGTRSNEQSPQKLDSDENNTSDLGDGKTIATTRTVKEWFDTNKD